MISNLEAVANELELQVQNFTDYAVVGVSGGVDSAVVASICVRALGKENVYLISMPYDEVDTNTFNARSTELANSLGAHHHIVSIGESTKALSDQLEEVFAGAELDILTYANLRPRVRMNVLYAISGELGYSHQKRARVMGTGHLSEDLIGYDTKGGDALADIFILSDLVKSEVYQLAEYYQVPESILQATPSAGLYADQTDEKELGFSYDKLEAPTLAVFDALQSGVTREELSPSLERFKTLPQETLCFVIERYLAHFHKHEAPQTVALRRHTEWFSS